MKKLINIMTIVVALTFTMTATAGINDGLHAYHSFNSQSDGFADTSDSLSVGGSFVITGNMNSVAGANGLGAYRTNDITIEFSSYWLGDPEDEIIPIGDDDHCYSITWVINLPEYPMFQTPIPYAGNSDLLDGLDISIAFVVTNGDAVWYFNGEPLIEAEAFGLNKENVTAMIFTDMVGMMDSLRLYDVSITEDTINEIMAVDCPNCEPLPEIITDVIEEPIDITDAIVEAEETGEPIDISEEAKEAIGCFVGSLF